LMCRLASTLTPTPRASLAHAMPPRLFRTSAERQRRLPSTLKPHRCAYHRSVD